MSLTEHIARLENDLQKLIRDWDRYFAGDLRVPPNLEQDRFANRLRSLSGQQLQRRADQFRVEQLQHRFMTYATNWERMLREREEGRGRFAGAGRGFRAHHASTNVRESGSVNPPEKESLYDRYVDVKRKHGQKVAVDRATFDAQMAAKRKKLASRLGEDVQFDVLVEDGKVKLAARRRRRAGKQE
jgi:hypothetical protein